MDEKELKQRTKRFALETIKLVEKLPQEWSPKPLEGKLLGGNVGRR